MADDVLARMKENHGVVPGAELAILALGRFGGRSLTNSSDLDIIYLFTGDYRANSDGRRSLDANEYFSRVAQQITTAMSARARAKAAWKSRWCPACRMSKVPATMMESSCGGSAAMGQNN